MCEMDNLLAIVQIPGPYFNNALCRRQVPVVANEYHVATVGGKGDLVAEDFARIRKRECLAAGRCLPDVESVQLGVLAITADNREVDAVGAPDQLGPAAAEGDR